MNNNNLKNRLKSEIESITPRVYDNVVQSSYIEKPVAKTKKASASKAFRIATSAVACVLIMAIAITCGVLFAPRKDNSPISNYYYVQVSAGADKATAAADEKTDGAKITLTLNSEETVETVRAENVDGDMILHLSGELKGLKFDVATRKINEAARTLKFVDDADGLSVSVSGETAESFAKRLRAAFDFSLSIKTISKEDLADRAKKYLPLLLKERVCWKNPGSATKAFFLTFIINMRKKKSSDKISAATT